MDLTFPAKPQTLSVISCTQLSLASASSIRREFLGSGHNLRPPGGSLRSRGCKYRKLDLFQRSQSRKLLVNASLINSNSVTVVVAVTTLSALSIVYFNQYLNKKTKKNISKEVLDFINSALAQLGKNIVRNISGIQVLNAGDGKKVTPVVQSKNFVEKERERIHGSQVLDVGDLNRVTDVVESKVLEENVKEKRAAVVNQETPRQYQENTLTLEKPVLVQTKESPTADLLTFNGCNYVVLEESEASILSSVPHVIHESGGVLPLILATEMSELTLGKSEKETEFDPVFHELMVKPSTLVPVNGRERDGIIKESVREDIYTFYGAKQSVVKSTSCLNGLRALSSHGSSVQRHSLSSMKVNKVLKGAKLSAQQSFQTAGCVRKEHIERQRPLAHYEGGSFQKKKTLRRNKGSGHKDQRHLIREKQTELPKGPHPCGMNTNEKVHPPELFSAYYRFLRDGRLVKCVDLLEDMERMGLLDMDKIYHAKFFNICKTQKAVKEAFRFCKLVPNPSLSTFNMLMSVCATSQDSEGAFDALKLAQETGLKADCKLYTTLISTCAKSGKVDAMFEVFHEMVNAGIEPNVHTYGALIDGCARAGQVAKAFGAYGIMRSKKVRPDRVIFNALITACGESGAVDRAFDVLAEMRAETVPIDPDHITVGALMKACANAGQVDRAKEVYKMIHEYNIKGTPEVYTIAVNSSSQTGDWEFAWRVYDDMTERCVAPDEMFLSALIDVAGHAGNVDAAFEIVKDSRARGTLLGIIPYSSLMGACSNAKNWHRALELYDHIKSIKLKPTVSTMNALITALCDGDQLPKAIEVLSEMKGFGLCPNTITYSILLVASERKDDLEVGLMLLSEAKNDGVTITLTMYKCIIGMCLRSFEKACSLGEPIFSLASGRPQIENKWTSLALMVYREAVLAGEKPSMEFLSQVLGCLQLPCEASLKDRLIENLGVTAQLSRYSNLCSLLDGFGEYDPRAFSLLEEAASLGIVPLVSFKENPFIVDAKKLQVHIAEVYILTILKGLKHRLAAGAKLPNITILLPTEKAQITAPGGEERTINLAARISQAVASLLRRLGLPYQGSESYGKIRINGISLRRWFQPKLASPFSGGPGELSSSQLRIGKGIIDQQRNIRTSNLSLE